MTPEAEREIDELLNRPAEQSKRFWNYVDGRVDRLTGKPCRSSNGRYLDGWYSVDPNTRRTGASIFYLTPAE